jgi:hypothetical protein
MKTDNILITALILTILISCYKVDNLTKDIEVLTYENDLYKKRYIDQSEKLLNHILINLKLNDITDTYRSSRNKKLKDKELIKLMQNVN